MKTNRAIVLYFLAMIFVAAVYRVIPRPLVGFAPMIAIALFSGAIVKDKKIAFLLPFLAMLLSDLLYEVLFSYELAPYGGFYDGMWQNYICILLTTIFGFYIRRINVQNILAASIAGPTLYFILSNFLVWAGHGGYQRPMTFSGLIQCYVDGLPFYWGSLAGTAFFSILFFGSYVLLTKRKHTAVTV